MIAKTAQADGIETKPGPKLTEAKLRTIEKVLFSKAARKLSHEEAEQLQLIALHYHSASKLHHTSVHELNAARISLQLYVNYLADILQTSDELFKVLSEPQNSSFQVLDDQGLEYANEISDDITQRLSAVKRLSENLRFRIRNNKGGSPIAENQEAVRECVNRLRVFYKDITKKKATYTYNHETGHKSPFAEFAWAFLMQIDSDITWEYLMTILRDIVKYQK